MKIEFTEKEIWNVWNEIVDHPENAGIASFTIIKKVIEVSLEVCQSHG